MSNQGGSEDQIPSTLMEDLANVGDHTGLVNVLKDKLQNLAVQSSGILNSLPLNVQKRVSALQELQGQHDELEKMFFEERASLEAKYQKLYEPLYSKRFQIVNGIVDVENEEHQNDTSADNNNAREKGVPEFWLTAMKTNEVLAAQITDHDEDALKYLRDIRWYRIDDPKGFKLDFYFDTNPYFSNSMLSKAYHMIDDDEPILERAVGTDIQWFPGKNLTQKIMKKKPKKGAKNAKPTTKMENCESFFNFFYPPEVPEYDDEIDQDAAEQLQDLMEEDFDVGSTIRDKIIPHAVSWFTGEADQDEYVDDDDEEDEDEEDNEEDEDEEDEEDEDEDENGTSRRKRSTGNKSGQFGEQPPECKQQ
eukprot:Gb_41264 [translate_table: standard]